MKRYFIMGLMLAAPSLTISVPAHADKFPFNNLEVEITCLPEIDVPDIAIADLKCKQIIPTSDIVACLNAGGQVGTVGTRPVCKTEAKSKARPKVGPSLFYPDAIMAKSFVPVAVPVELYNGGKDPRANATRPRPIEQIPVPRAD